MCVRRFEVRAGRLTAACGGDDGRVGVVVWWVARESAGGGYRALTPSSVHFSYYVNNRQPNGSRYRNVLSSEACSSGGERVVGDGETQWKEHEREGDQKETRHRVLACVPSECR